MNNITVQLSSQQFDFITSDHKFTLISGGLGSGKSVALVIWAITMRFAYPNAQGIITNNTYKQLQDSTLTTMFRLLTDMSIPFSYNGQRGELIIDNGMPIHCRSMENYNTLRGAEYGWAACDEMAFYRKEAFDVLIGRVRDKRGPLLIKGATTPNGYNWVHEQWVEKPTPWHKLVKTSSYDNPHLPVEYILSLEEQYDPKLVQQEIYGEFVNLTAGRVYYSFDRKINTLPIARAPQGQRIYVGCDFNVNPITAVAMWIDNGVIHVFDEIYLNDSNTYQLAKEILKKWGRLVTVIPDATGKARKTSAVLTDHQILIEAGLRVAVEASNPHVKDRYNCINGLLSHNKLWVGTQCTNLIKDLERLDYENKDPLLSHISDAMGYAAWYLAPLEEPARPSRSYSV